MADSILRLKVESQEYDAKIKRAAEGLRRYVDVCHQQGDVIGRLLGDTRKYVDSIGQMETVNKTARGSVNELKSAFTEFRHVYNQLSDEEKKGDFGKQLNSQLEQLKVRIHEGENELKSINNEINGGGGLKDALDQVAGKFGLNIEQLTKFGGAAGLATTALKVAKDAFFQSESNIDEWGRTVEGAKSAYNTFLDTLNNGNWSNFFQNLQTAIQGGRDLYDVFDRLGSIKSNNAAAIAMVQQQIAQLRLAKQQGENVDAQLKEATARLAQLQKQSINAGKAAGTQSAFQTIRNGVNSIGGAGVNDATIQYAVERIMKNGQSEFDKYKYNYQALEAKGTRTVVTPGVGWDSQGNKNPDTRNQVFDITLLTEEQQKQYALAKAITEGETRIQQGIAAYAQAVQEGTSSAREEFKGNRYALQGSGGSSTTPKSGGKEFNIASIAFNPKEFDDNLKFDPSQYAKGSGLRPENILGPSDEWESYKDTVTGTISSISDAMNNLSVENFQESYEKVNKDVSKLTDTAKQNKAAMGLAAQAASSFSSALAGMEDPGAKAAGTVIGAIANIALGFAYAASAKDTTASGWAWLAWVAAGMAALATTISTVHSLTGYAQGGIVEGNSYSGDNIPIMANAGEVVLTKAQQNNLAQTLEGNGLGNINVTGRLNGTDILLSADRAAQASGRGQLVTWK